MTSLKQIEANRRNAQRSTGPRTAEGKARSAMNAQKHGLTSKDVIVESENEDEFRTLAEGLLEYLQPQNVLEDELAWDMVRERWTIRRILRIERATLESGVWRQKARSASEVADELTPDPMDKVLRGAEKAMSKLASDGAAYQRAQDEVRLAQAKAASEDTVLAAAFRADLNNRAYLAKLRRYKRDAERAFYRAMREFERLEKRRREISDDDAGVRTSDAAPAEVSTPEAA